MRQGQDDVTKALIAVAAGNSAEAGRLAVSARKRLGVTPATQLLQAQAAQLAGDENTAREIFQALAEDPDSAVLGYRGLIMEARRAGDWLEIERLADALHSRKPDTPWLNLVLFEIAARRQDWHQAKTFLTPLAAGRLLEAQQLKRYRAALLIAEAQMAARRGDHEKALEAAEQAIRQTPDGLPAIIALAEAQLAAGHRRAALRTAEKHWPSTPHPRLAAIYRISGDDPIEAYRQIERLCRGNEDAPASRLALAEAALAADIWGEARRHLIALISRDQATAAAYRLMARLERREGGDERAALQWLAKLADAPPDAAWRCSACNGAQDEWLPACRPCGAFATLDWQEGRRKAGLVPFIGTMRETGFGDTVS
jgi:HemY protein